MVLSASPRWASPCCSFARALSTTFTIVRYLSRRLRGGRPPLADTTAGASDGIWSCSWTSK